MTVGQPIGSPVSQAALPGPVLGSAGRTPPERTLVDILVATVERHPDALAIDDGSTTLTYRDLLVRVRSVAGRLAEQGIGRGDRVGVRLPSGSHHLYTAILAILAAGAAYVPVDADDPEDRARVVFAEAGVKSILDDLRIIEGAPESDRALVPIDIADDAWIIFTSGSTGVPKGVAVTHRSAAALVDAEAALFLQDAPIGPGDRVLAGLSVAFDASCEEMWLAWRNGACMVPAPRSLVRSGIDLGAWLVTQRISVVSTVPTLAALWPQESLDAVRLLIFGGEACPPELAERLVDEGREVWNTYGPTEATVVSCAARLLETGPVSIGLPLDGWELAVVDEDDRPVAVGQVGQLIIGGVGLARYLDPAKDEQLYAPMPSLGWSRAYRSGDLVMFDPAGLVFIGRADEQVKLGGRRIELGEIDAALLTLDGVAAAAAAVRRSPAGTPLLVGYVVRNDADGFDPTDATASLRRQLPAALVPVLAVVDTIPTKTSGKVDRDTLPWPVAGTDAAGGPALELTGPAAELADDWSAVLGAPVTALEDDFFAHGGGSLAAAQLVSRLRTRHPHITVGDIYRLPRFEDLAALLATAGVTPAATRERRVRPMPRTAQAVQIAITAVVATITSLQWLTALAALGNLLADGYAPTRWAPTVSWWWVAVGGVLFISPFGRMGIAAIGARLLLRGVQPGDHPRGGSVHLRLWAAERLADGVGAINLAGAPWISYYARALGARVGRDVDLHSVPPITGMLRLGAGAAIEPEVDLSGYWVDGDVVHIGRIDVQAGACVRARSTLGPGASIGRGAEIDAGSFVEGQVPAGERWAGSPAAPVGRAGGGWPEGRPSRRRRWLIVYGVTSALFSALPVATAIPSLLLVAAEVHDAHTLAGAVGGALLVTPVATLTWLVAVMVALTVIIRLLGVGVRPGEHPVRSRIGWQIWATERLMDAARSLLFPIYSSLFTPVWLRLLGTEVGKGVEASTVLVQPTMTSIGDHAFLADDTMVGSYELRGGWLRVDRARVGKRGFLGNSATVAPGRSVPKNGLVAVLSAAPPKAKKGSSWLGSPPVRLRRSPDAADTTRTFDPPIRLKVIRALVECCRFVPTALTVALGVGVFAALEAIRTSAGWVVAALLGGLVLLATGAVAGIVTILAKLVLVGRTPVTQHPLWSGFVWRNEVVDTFVEVVAAPWFARAAAGTAVLNVFLRGLGADIARGVWCETYWLPEADLVRLGVGATVNRGCVVQTHLFHDRIMRMDRVDLAAGATLGPHSVILPAAGIGTGAVVGPASLVMRGEIVPSGTRWIGNPIVPWTDSSRTEAAT